MLGLLNIFRRQPHSPVVTASTAMRGWTLATDAFAEFCIQGKVTEPATFVRVSKRKVLRENSTKEIYWGHPAGHPFSVEGGPLGGDAMPTDKPWDDWENVWTNVPVLEGYRLVMCDYTDRIYHVWKGNDA